MDRPEIIIRCENCGKDNLHIVQFKSETTEGCMKCGSQLISYKPIKGYVYILSNPRMKNLYKVGYSTRDVHERVKELNSAMGVPAEFVIEEYFSSTEPGNHESKIHQILAPYRIKNKEFFECELSEIIGTLRGRNLKGT